MTTEGASGAWEYGAAHVFADGSVDTVYATSDLAAAEREVEECQQEGLGCYVVRRPTNVEWQRAHQKAEGTP